ncbi:MAG: pyrroline-5-carboxylate reductase [Alphaproteobacteria bacterium]
MERPILLVGGGKMGGALLEGWLARSVSPRLVTVVEPDAARSASLASSAEVAVHADLTAIDAGLEPAVVVLAVKPQIMDAVVPAYRRFAKPGCVFLSIAAGKTIAGFERALGATTAIVRSMPNTPAAIGRGMTVACANRGVNAQQRELCDKLLTAVGEVAWVEDEALLDAVTAVSGSGPAYVFLLAESMAEAGVAAGLPRALAERLARATVAGAGELLHESPEPASVLRQNVTSPAGTTAAALAVLMGTQGWQPIITKAIAAAADRSRELSG